MHLLIAPDKLTHGTYSPNRIPRLPRPPIHSPLAPPSHHPPESGRGRATSHAPARRRLASCRPRSASSRCLGCCRARDRTCSCILEGERCFGRRDSQGHRRVEGGPRDACGGGMRLAACMIRALHPRHKPTGKLRAARHHATAARNTSANLG